MSTEAVARTFRLGRRVVNRLGFGAMQLAGPGVFGPPTHKETAIAVLREAVSRGINHIDTSDFYGPHITNQLIREALHPYPEDVVIATKVGARRDPTGTVHPAMLRDELTQAVHDNLRNLGIDVLEVVNLRSMLRDNAPAEGSIEEPLAVIAELQRQGLIRHIGLSNVTVGQVSGRTQDLRDRLCAKPLQSRGSRGRRFLVDQLSHDGIAYVAYFPLGGINSHNRSRRNSPTLPSSLVPRPGKLRSRGS